MKNIKTVSLSFLIAVISFINVNLIAQTADKTNYVVVLDLSDRILNQAQVKQDIAAIMEVYSKFEKDVRSQLIIKSNARFSIHILKQNKSKLNSEFYNEKLSLDMSMYKIAEKRKVLDKFSKNIKPMLVNLYQKANYSNNKNDYQGVDIWKFFNESLIYYLDGNYKNTLVVLTDGYFDFEKNNYVIKTGNRYTSTKFLKYLRVNNWKQKAETANYGLLRINRSFPKTNVVVLGISPKNESLDERAKLHYFWSKWLGEMNMSYRVIDSSTFLITKQQLLSSL